MNSSKPNERETIVAERKKKNASAAAKAKAEKAEKNRLIAERTNAANIASLRATFHRKANTHLISAKFFDFQHKYAIFLPLQIVVAIIAISAFLATYYESARNPSALKIGAVQRCDLLIAAYAILTSMVLGHSRYQGFPHVLPLPVANCVRESSCVLSSLTRRPRFYARSRTK